MNVFVGGLIALGMAAFIITISSVVVNWFHLIVKGNKK